MQQTINVGQVQPAILSRVERIAKNCKEIVGNLKKVSSKWLHAESVTFSRFCEEKVTRRDVLLTALGVFVGMPVVFIITGLVLGGGAS